MYGLILRIEYFENLENVEFVYLTPHITLASIEAPTLKIDDGPFEMVKLTHITQSVPKKELTEVARPLKQVRDLQKVKELVKKLSNVPYGRIHREFFDAECKFVDFITELITDFEKIIKLLPNIFESLKSEIAEHAIAASFGKVVRFGRIILVNAGIGAKLYFDDMLANKVGKIFIKGKLVFEGKLTNRMLLLHLAQFIPIFEEGDIVVEVDETN